MSEVQSHPSPELDALLNSTEPAALVDAVFGSVPAGMIIARASDGKILRVSDYSARLFAMTRGDVEDRRTLAESRTRVAVHDASGRRLSESEWPVSRALLGEIVNGFEARVGPPDGDLTPVSINAAPIRNARGEVIGAISSVADLRPFKALESDLRQALAQRDTLHRELTHRVKNHLQIISALVALEARNPALSAKDLGEKVRRELDALAAVYKGMDRADAGAGIEARTFVEEICRPYGSSAVSVDTAVTPPDLTLASEQAGPLGMLVNEAVCNSRKHAFRDRPGGHIRVSLRREEGGQLRLEVADDGVGWGPVDPGHISHGLDLMKEFARQLHSELEFSEAPGGGARVAAEIQAVA